MQIDKAGGALHAIAAGTMDTIAMWQAVAVAPTDQDVEVAVIDRDGEHPVVFPCRRIADGWVSANTRRRVDIRPTHWRPWTARPQASAR